MIDGSPGLRVERGRMGGDERRRLRPPDLVLRHLIKAAADNGQNERKPEEAVAGSETRLSCLEPSSRGFVGHVIERAII